MQQPAILPSPPPFDLLVWDDNQGIGYCPTRPALDLYTEAYWDEYVQRADTPMGRALTAARCALVQKHIGDATLVDIGIGSGQFVATRGGETYGHDVNPRAFAWLSARGLWRDEAELAEESPNLCYWDSLEHIDDPRRLLRACRGHVFVSMPIYAHRRAVIESKHFKPGEHLWYFTWRGLVGLAYTLGFVLVEENTMEEDLGREGITTFVFRRKGIRSG